MVEFLQKKTWCSPRIYCMQSNYDLLRKWIAASGKPHINISTKEWIFMIQLCVVSVWKALIVSALPAPNRLHVAFPGDLFVVCSHHVYLSPIWEILNYVIVVCGWILSRWNATGIKFPSKQVQIVCRFWQSFSKVLYINLAYMWFDLISCFCTQISVYGVMEMLWEFYGATGNRIFMMAWRLARWCLPAKLLYFFLLIA